MPLGVAFPSLYAIAASKDALVTNVWGQGKGGGWNPLFARPFSDWDMKEISNLLLRISEENVEPGIENNVVWLEEKSGQFTVKSLLKVLQPGPSCSFPENIIWQSKVQPRVCFFCCFFLVFHGKQPWVRF